MYSPGAGRAVATPDVDYDLADAAAHRGLAAERVGPEAVDDAALERLGGEDAERRARVERAGHGRDRDPVARGIDAGLGEQAQEGAIGPGGGADPEALDRRDVAARAPGGPPAGPGATACPGTA